MEYSSSSSEDEEVDTAAKGTATSAAAKGAATPSAATPAATEGANSAPLSPDAAQGNEPSPSGPAQNCGAARPLYLRGQRVAQ